MSAAALLALALLAPQERVVVDRDDVLIDRDCVVEVGVEVIEDANGDGVIRIVGEGVTVDFAGARLHGAPPDRDPDAHAGWGIVIEAEKVTLRNANVSGFKVGILAREADGLVLEDCDVSGNFRQRLGSTPEAEEAGDWLWPHANDGKEWRTNYGAGICVEGSQEVTVRRCRARAVQNGLLLDRVTRSSVYDNDFSFLSGWGIAMWRSSRNRISRNALDFCVRGYSHGVYNRGQDSAGLLMFEQCSRNVVVENSITHGGDGVFGFAGKEALGEVPGPEGFDHQGKGCNSNDFHDNDLSYAAAHGLEMTFSFDNQVSGNRFVENAICGIWGGYSQRMHVWGNRFERNGDAGYGLERGGVNIEHSTENHIRDNRFVDNACGVHLWWDADEGLMGTPWARANGGECRDNRIEQNVFEGDRVGIHARGCAATRVRSNRFEEVELEVDSDPPVEELAADTDGTTSLPEAIGETRPLGARDHLQGRDRILMTEWGPYDWEGPYLHRLPGRGVKHVWRWLGGEELADVSAEGEVEVSTVTGGPFPLIVVTSDVEGTLVPYELAARSGTEVVRGSGELSTVRWAVRVFPWTVDPREDEDGWRAEAEDAVAFEVGELDLVYGMGGPSQLELGDEGLAVAELPTDRFGTLAETEIRLPAGRWELAITSDDGVRVRVDGEVVHEDWTWHGPKTETVSLEIAETRALRLAVDHFELDGYAVLKLELRPAR